MFSNWSLTEKKKCITSLYDLEAFLKVAYSKSDTPPSWTLIRSVHDWMYHFDKVATTFKNYGDARIFRIQKNETNKVVMTYKTNCTETAWRGFLVSQKDGTQKETGIALVTSYLRSPPPSIDPEPLDSTIINQLRNDTSLNSYYDVRAKNWLDKLAVNSTEYLEDVFPGEKQQIAVEDVSNIWLFPTTIPSFYREGENPQLEQPARIIVNPFQQFQIQHINMPLVINEMIIYRDSIISKCLLGIVIDFDDDTVQIKQFEVEADKTVYLKPKTKKTKIARGKVVRSGVQITKQHKVGKKYTKNLKLCDF
jgi:hypothetical protein